MAQDQQRSDSARQPLAAGANRTWTTGRLSDRATGRAASMSIDAWRCRRRKTGSGAGDVGTFGAPLIGDISGKTLTVGVARGPRLV